MAMDPERSKPLHNFTLPRLRWASQRHLRCMKLNSVAATSSPARDIRFFPSFGSPDHRRIGMESKSIVGGGPDTGIRVVREKLLLDLRAETNMMKNKLFREEEEKEEEPTEAATVAEEEVAESCTAEARPWNLRTRRSACKAPVVSGNGESTGRAGAGMSGRVLRGNGGGANATAETEEERVKFSVALDRNEIEEDFLKFAGRRPSRRPKKRPRTVQKQLDSLFPGLWLSEITADTYKVQEIADNGKR